MTITSYPTVTVFIFLHPAIYNSCVVVHSVVVSEMLGSSRCCFILPKILSSWLRPLAAKVTGFNIHLLWRNQTLCSPFKCSVHGMNSCLPSFLRRDSMPQLLSILQYFCHQNLFNFPPLCSHLTAMISIFLQC